MDIAATASQDATYFEQQMQAGNTDQDYQQLYALREANYQQLLGIIQDDCGRNDAGELPDACTDDALAQSIAETTADTPSDAAASNASLDAAAQQVFEQFAQAPRDSWSTLLAQFQQLRSNGANSPAIAQHIQVAQPPEDEISQTLQSYYGAIYALGVAAAFADAETLTAIEDLLEMLQEQSGVMQSLYPEAPGPALAYDFSGYPEPVDAASAAACLAEVRSRTQQQLGAMVTSTKQEQWQQIALLFSGDLAAAGA